MQNSDYVDTFLRPREEHYQQFFGPITQDIMHSTDSQEVHIDIYQFEPTPERPFWTLITSGMSNQRQLEPKDCDEHILPRTEILMYVSKPQGWMFSVLKRLAEMPFKQKTFLYYGHTVPNGKPMTAQPSLLTSFLFVPPYFEQPEINQFQLDDDEVNFLWMIPITEAEREFAVKQSSQKLYEKFEDADTPIVVNEKRKSLVEDQSLKVLFQRFMKSPN